MISFILAATPGSNHPGLHIADSAPNLADTTVNTIRHLLLGLAILLCQSETTTAICESLLQDENLSLST